MGFQRARNKEQFEQREAEIINSAMMIYEEFGFEAVTFSKISEKTKFTRPTIYSYFKTKEEIMLKLTAIYLEKFVSCFEGKFNLTKDNHNEFVATALSDSFMEVGEFIHLYTVLFSVIEKNVTVEALAKFKEEIVVYQARLVEIFREIYVNSSDEEVFNFLVFSLCFASGICPMSEENEIQKEAVKLSGTECHTPNLEKLFKDTLLIYLEKLSR